MVEKLLQSRMIDKEVGLA